MEDGEFWNPCNMARGAHALSAVRAPSGPRGEGVGDPVC